MALFTRKQEPPQGQLPPPGWHDAPDQPGFYRWWDGARWTEHVHPKAGADARESRNDTLVAMVRLEGQDTRPARPVRPWARAAVRLSIVGENNYGGAFERLLRRNGGRREEWGAEFTALPATAAAEPSNAYDENAVAIHVQGELVGYLPRDAAVRYSPPLRDLAERGEYLVVEARVWVAPQGDERMGSVTVSLPPPHGVQSFNELPEEAHTVLPEGAAIQVAGEDQHMDVLGKYVSDGERYLAVSLHLVQEQKTERSAPYACVEVRLDGHRVGVLTKAASEKLSEVINYVTERHKVPVCRAVLKGSPLAAELVLYVAKSHEVTRRWLDDVDSGS